MTAACELIDLDRTHMYRLKAKSKPFSDAWDEAVQLGTKALEDEATRRAKDGWDEPVFYQGDQCGVVRKFSDTLLIFLLKARDPKFREQQTTTLRTDPSEPLVVIDAKLDPVDVAKLYHQIMGN